MGVAARFRAAKFRVIAAGLVLAATGAVLVGCHPEGPPAAHAASCTVGLVGDSLSVGIEPYFGAELAARGCQLAYFDARVSRFTAEGVAMVEALAAAGRLPDILVVALGTNDSANAERFAGQIDRIVAAAGARPVLWVNVDRAATEDVLNRELVLAMIRHTTLWIHDWNGFVDPNPQIRARDGIHLTSGGYRLRAALVAREVAGY